MKETFNQVNYNIQVDGAGFSLASFHLIALNEPLELTLKKVETNGGPFSTVYLDHIPLPNNNLLTNCTHQNA